MQTDEKFLKACARRALQELANLKNTKKELESSVRELNARRADVERKRSAEHRRGKEIREEVKNWFNDVEEIKEEVQNYEGLIGLLCAPENILRIVVATSSETSSSAVSYGGDATIYGVGGIGTNSFNFERSIITTNVGEVKTTIYHHYHDKGKE